MSKALELSVTAWALYRHKGEGYEMLKRWVLSRDRKIATGGAEVTRSGRLFQTRAAATGKDRSPTVDSRVWLTINDEDELV